MTLRLLWIDLVAISRDAALKAATDMKYGLIGLGVYTPWIRATHRMERRIHEINSDIEIKVLRGSAKGAEQSTFIWGDVCAGRHVRLEEKID